MNQHYRAQRDQLLAFHAQQDIDDAIRERARVLAIVGGDKDNIAYYNADVAVRLVKARLARLQRKLVY